MTMDQQKGDYVFVCDVCGQVLESKTSNFDAARNYLRRMGWKPVKLIGETDWEHRCEDCQ